MITPRKVWTMLASPRPIHKAWVALNSTPLQLPIKKTLELAHLREKSLRRSLVKTLPSGEPIQAHVDALRRDGYAVVDSMMNRPLLHELCEESTRLVQRANNIGENDSSHFSRKPFWSRLLDEEMAASRLTTESVFVRFAMQPDVIATVARYFEEVPVIEYVFLAFSQHIPDPLTASQLWHRDHDDVKTLKLFVYLSDVTEVGAGPFTFYPRSVSQNVRESFIAKHMPDAEMQRRSGAAKPMQVFGPTFASFMVDTRCCYHMGSRVAEGQSRLMYTASFISAPAMYPNFSKIVVTAPQSQIGGLLLRT